VPASVATITGSLAAPAIRSRAGVRYAAKVGRGADPEDADLFAARWLPTLRTATAELSWLASRGYAEPSALALVGNRHELRLRQREAVRRAAAPDDVLATRIARRRAPAVAGAPLAIDGFNCLITLEAALRPTGQWPTHGPVLARWRASEAARTGPRTTDVGDTTRHRSAARRSHRRRMRWRRVRPHGHTDRVRRQAAMPWRWCVATCRRFSSGSSKTVLACRGS
jgi:hypothetical protein